MTENHEAENPWTWEEKHTNDQGTQGAESEASYNQTPGVSVPEAQPTQQPYSYGYNSTTGYNQQPGIIPLRPLKISDLLEGSFGAVRANPGVMFGFSIVLTGIVAVISGLATAYSPISNLLSNLDNPETADKLFNSNDGAWKMAEALAGGIATIGFTSLLNFFALIVLNGILTYAVSRAVIGRVASLNITWKNSRGRIPSLIGIAIITSVITGLSIIIAIGTILVIMFLFGAYSSNDVSANMGAFGATIAAAILIAVFIATILTLLFMVKFSVAPIAAVLESAGPFTALKRSWVLTKGFFWPTLGRLLLIQILIGVISQIFSLVISTPAGLMLDQTWSLAVGTMLGTLLTGLIAPLQSAYITLIYIDMRIRKENLAQALLEESLR